MSRALIVLAASAAILGAASPAQADFRADYTGTGPGVNGTSYFAGALNWRPQNGGTPYITNSANDIAAIAGTASSTFVAFCIQTNQTLVDPSTFTIAALTAAPVPPPAMTSAQATKISQVWATYRNTLTTNAQYAAFQVALWKILATPTLANYNAYVFAGNAQANTDALAMIAGAGTATANLVALTSAGGQDMIVEVRSGWRFNPTGGFEAVPAPSAFLLAGLGLPLFGMMRRRFRKSTTETVAA